MKGEVRGLGWDGKGREEVVGREKCFRRTAKERREGF